MSSGRDSIVGAVVDPDPAPGAQQKFKILSPVPGSDQFHEGIGTSTVEQLRSLNSVQDRNLKSFDGGRRWQRRDDGEGKGGGEEICN
ncbi:hypothetical protein F511_22055 [Dorcoceras hygrometricum]|uniref:Uncharacterized protein n=1 Tax=Dorcoceras hygrometricum TaxID=472368 RepID=A0A2Z7CBB2_9LAMI|nr:hypothetical protein F511_22055 [Dorcoceras hygrometricum]